MELHRSLNLGAFELVEPLSRGGMAEVWRGVHRDEGVPVAIKLVTEERARTRHLREALENEVRAMARLDHPGIVRVHDYGEVPRSVAEDSGGRLAPASPYLVMELAEGTLAPRHVRDSEELVAALSAILEALSHAHARGVVHRDIKPSNVLVARGTFKLSDFGIANALALDARNAPSEPLSAGTVGFMAPEQVLALHRDEGPWTDLYAVGCLAFLLATGTLPFPSRDRDIVYRAHCLSAPPRLVPRFVVPSDLELWMQVVLAKRPRDRFPLAADALRALRSLGGAPIDPPRVLPSGSLPPDTTTLQSDTRAPTSGSGSTATVIDGLELAMSDARPALVRRAEALRDALEVSVPAAPMEPRTLDRELLTGIGLGVYGLRPIPLVGRERERARLWSRLAETWESGAPHVVELRGRAGLGKTRLAEWLAERAVETGAAASLFTGLGPTPSPLEGLARMIARHLRVEGLSREQIEARLARHPTERALDALDASELGRLVDLLAPGDPVRAVTRLEERFAVAERLLAALGARRPVLLVFDDAQLAREPMAFAEHLLRPRSGRLPVLVVLTVQEESLEERAEAERELDALALRRGAERIVLGPLDGSIHARLVESILGLEPALAHDIAARTAGNPLFAIQLVGDWVDRGALVVSEGGFALRQGARLDLPDDIHALWSARLGRLLASLDPRQREAASTALELAALLGRRVEHSEWNAACAEAGIELPERLLDRLASLRLAQVARTRLSFVHGMLAESLVRRARESDRLPALERACARALERDPGARQTERVGRHLAAAGDAHEAAPLLLSAAYARLLVCDFAEVHALASLRDDALAAAGVPENHSTRAYGHVVRADAAVAAGRIEECTLWMDRAAKVDPPDDRVVAELAQLSARVALKRGQNEESVAWYAEALEATRRIGDAPGVARALHGIGEAEKLLGRLDDSLRHHEEAALRFDELGAVVEAARVRMGIGDVVRRRGELDRAVELITSALAVLRPRSNGHAVAVALNTLGDVARARGELERAEGYYGEAIEELEALGSFEATIIRLNVGIAQLARARWGDARRTFEVALAELDREKRRGYRAFALAGLWAASAGLAEWDDYDRRGHELEALLAAVPLLDEDLAWCLARAGEGAHAAGERARARPAFELALRQWRGLGRAGEAGAIEALLT